MNRIQSGALKTPNAFRSHENHHLSIPLAHRQCANMCNRIRILGFRLVSPSAKLGCGSQAGNEDADVPLLMLQMSPPEKPLIKSENEVRVRTLYNLLNPTRKCLEEMNLHWWTCQLSGTPKLIVRLVPIGSGLLQCDQYTFLRLARMKQRSYCKTHLKFCSSALYEQIQYISISSRNSSTSVGPTMFCNLRSKLVLSETARRIQDQCSPCINRSPTSFQ